MFGITNSADEKKKKNVNEIYIPVPHRVQVLLQAVPVLVLVLEVPNLLKRMWSPGLTLYAGFFLSFFFLTQTYILIQILF